MVLIEEILQLPKDEQLAIMHAIQDNLGDVDEDEYNEESDEDVEVSDEIIAFVEARIKHIKETNQPGYTWEQVEENLKNLRSTK